MPPHPPSDALTPAKDWAARVAALGSAPNDVPATPDGIAALTHILAHRLNGLVSTIETYADLLIDTLNTREQRAMALGVFEAAAQIERVVADLKRYGQAVEPVLQPVCLETFAQALPPLFAAADAARLRFDVDAPAGSPVQADPVLLRQAVMVLVQNALDAAPPPAAITLRLHLDGEGARLSVWNEGAIAEAETEARLFQPFFTTKAQNLGVGLPLARRIAQAHGGSLRLVTSDACAGTCFELRLPRARAESALALRPPLPS